MTVEIIMDASNSMTGMIGKETKMAAARRVLTQTIDGLPETMRVGLRVYGHRYATDDYDNACRDTELRRAHRAGRQGRPRRLGRQDPDQGPDAARGRACSRRSRTSRRSPTAAIVLVTDGIESCKGDIKSIAPAIKAAGLELKVNIVGFDIKEAEGSGRSWSRSRKSTGGRYLDARNADELLSALGQTLKRRVRRARRGRQGARPRARSAAPESSLAPAPTRCG